MRIGGRERGKPDQAEDRRGVYRNCGWERISVCGVRKVSRSDTVNCCFGFFLWLKKEYKISSKRLDNWLSPIYNTISLKCLFGNVYSIRLMR